MKNVIKRCVSLLTLFNDKSTQISTEYIRDNISSYRDLSDSAFKRSFERDKVLLREMGYSLDYVNDKWSIDEGYNLSGTSIINSIKKNQNIEFNQFLNTYHIIKKYIDLGFKIQLPKDYGEHLGISDKQYTDLGVEILNNENEILNNSDILVQFNLYNDDQVSNLRENQILIGTFNTNQNKNIVNHCEAMSTH